MPISFIRLVVFLSFRIDGKKMTTLTAYPVPMLPLDLSPPPRGLRPPNSWATLLNPPSTLPLKQILLHHLLLLIRVFLYSSPLVPSATRFCCALCLPAWQHCPCHCCCDVPMPVVMRCWHWQCWLRLLCIVDPWQSAAAQLPCPFPR